MRGHRGYNICPWLKNGKREICGKSCREEYCKDHRTKIRNGSKIPRPCLSCGVGVRSEIQLCRSCGRETVRQRSAKLEKIRGFLSQRPPPPMPQTPPPLLFTPQTPRQRPPLETPPPSRSEKCFGMRDKCDTMYWTEPEFCFGLRD